MPEIKNIVQNYQVDLPKSENEILNICVIHCSIHQNITRPLREALQEALTKDCELKVEVFCPSQHKRHMQAIDDYWPKQLTRDYVAKKGQSGCDLFVASEPVVDTILRHRVFSCSDNKPVIKRICGEGILEQIKDFPETVLRGIKEVQNNYDSETEIDQEVFALEIRKVMKLIAEEILKKIACLKKERNDPSLDDSRRVYENYLNRLEKAS